MIEEIMIEGIKQLKPIVVKANWKNITITSFHFIICGLLWILLFLSSLNILFYYIHSIIFKGFLEAETLKYAMFIVIGAYFFLILNKKETDEAFGIKRNLEVITKEEAAKFCKK